MEKVHKIQQKNAAAYAVFLRSDETKLTVTIDDNVISHSQVRPKRLSQTRSFRLAGVLKSLPSALDCMWI